MLTKRLSKLMAAGAFFLLGAGATNKGHAMLPPGIHDRAGRWSPAPTPPREPLAPAAVRVDFAGGFEGGSALKRTDKPLYPYQRDQGTGALCLHLSVEAVLPANFLLGAFTTLGLGAGVDTAFTGVRVGYRPTPTVRLVAEVGIHSLFDIDNGVFTSSDIAGVNLPFAGGRVDFAPTAHWVAPLLSLVVRTDLTREQTSGTVTVWQFLDNDRIETRTYATGGVTVGLMAGVSFDFDALSRRAASRRAMGPPEPAPQGAAFFAP